MSIFKKNKSTRDEIIKANSNGEANPDDETKIIEMRLLDVEDELEQAKETARKIQEDIAKNAETCIRKISIRKKA